jgi:NTE family protein
MHNDRTLQKGPAWGAKASIDDRSKGSKLQHADFLLVGGGLACATAAETLRAGGAAGSVVILTAEDLPPYHHPPLSKEFLLRSGDEALIFIHPE